MEQLLYCLLLPSAADAANTLAEGVSGDIASFVELMNQKAESLSLKNTHFVNTYGRDDGMQLITVILGSTRDEQSGTKHHYTCLLYTSRTEAPPTKTPIPTAVSTSPCCTTASLKTIRSSRLF